MGVRPLEGKRIVVTRPRAQSADLCDRIEALGGVALRFPVLQIVSPADPAPIAAAVERLSRYDWVVFTSVNGVERFFGRSDVDVSALAPVRVAAIGPATGAALEHRGCAVNVMPEEYIAEQVAVVMGEVRGQTVLLARAANTRRTLALMLAEAGASVDDVAVYDTVAGSPAPEEWLALADGFDAVTFTSSSIVQHFLELVSDRGLLKARTVIACIGPVTARTAREHGLRVTGVAQSYTTDGLVDLLCSAYQNGGVHD